MPAIMSYTKVVFRDSTFRCDTRLRAQCGHSLSAEWRAAWRPQVGCELALLLDRFARTWCAPLSTRRPSATAGSAPLEAAHHPPPRHPR